MLLVTFYRFLQNLKEKGPTGQGIIPGPLGIQDIHQPRCHKKDTDTLPQDKDTPPPGHLGHLT